MGRYYFDVVEDVRLPDEEGQEYTFTDIAHLRNEALECAKELIAASARRGSNCLNWRIEVFNESRELVVVVKFSDALRYHPPLADDWRHPML